MPVFDGSCVWSDWGAEPSLLACELDTIVVCVVWMVTSVPNQTGEQNPELCLLVNSALLGYTLCGW